MPTQARPERIAASPPQVLALGVQVNAPVRLLGVSNPFAWIRDLLGIRKDAGEIRKTRLEVEKLEREERERELITPASFEQVKEFDPTVRYLSEVFLQELESIRSSREVEGAFRPLLPKHRTTQQLRGIAVLAAQRLVSEHGDLKAMPEEASRDALAWAIEHYAGDGD